MKKKDKDTIVAGVGSAIVGGAAKEIASVDALKGYPAKVEQTLKKNLKLSDSTAYHLAGLTRRVPAAALGSTATILTYDVLGKKKDKLSDKLKKGIIAGGVSTLVSLPLHSTFSALPPEYKSLSKSKQFLVLAKNRGLQSIISAPAALLTYEGLKGNKDHPGTMRTLGAALGGAGVGALATLPFAAKWEGLKPDVEAKAMATGQKLENLGKFFKLPMGSKTTLGKYLGRVAHSIGPRTLSGVLAAGASYAAYDIIKGKRKNAKSK